MYQYSSYHKLEATGEKDSDPTDKATDYKADDSSPEPEAKPDPNCKMLGETAAVTSTRSTDIAPDTVALRQTVRIAVDFVVILTNVPLEPWGVLMGSADTSTCARMGLDKHDNILINNELLPAV